MGCEDAARALRFPLRMSRSNTTSELFEFVNVRVSSNDRRNASLKTKPIRLRIARNSMASRYRMSSFAVRYRTASVLSSRSRTSELRGTWRQLLGATQSVTRCAFDHSKLTMRRSSSFCLLLPSCSRCHNRRSMFLLSSTELRSVAGFL
jgi:hypothetical protein